ncbi:MAG: hypothetical protein A2Y00_00420 [Omnitrophica WOR_2 bacterium GWF2_43_52]|nr:MAG: hypothetical protein A2Y01_07595 [Omnitrophica WOR_2 bacterium GWC2_44_8]OGX20929.1 MAG: hypothetical protein A2Y00_00420 [Omnitrophica WOR_2 bacterium GWF2_43_52]OGX55073.1 MAG: hypothetical protein A2460_05815 [Omnitrophica WOR_2 bacterium RIFOXYC2_FULL_43_9]HAH21106.1 hypothetical protein [Candidatus Omnitrophota bacterium]HBG63292.1 hypothetical protein [Candidatus Omnitrophota bacterium]
MKLKHFSIGLCFGIFLCLGYTWQQVEIIKLAYQGSRASTIYKEVLDRNHYLRYNLSILKSSSYLGNKLFNEGTSFEVPKESRILSLGAPKEESGGTAYARRGPSEIRESATNNNVFLSFSRIQDVWPVSFLKTMVNNQAQAQDITHK